MMNKLDNAIRTWKPHTPGGEVLCGDMPGDSVRIGEEHIRKAGIIFPALLPKLCALAQSSAVAFDDNRVRLDAQMTQGELAMLIAPKAEAIAAREAMIRRSGKPAHPYAGAMQWCAEHGIITKGTSPDAPVAVLPDKFFEPTGDLTRRGVYTAYKM